MIVAHVRWWVAFGLAVTLTGCLLPSRTVTRVEYRTQLVVRDVPMGLLAEPWGHTAKRPSVAQVHAMQVALQASYERGLRESRETHEDSVLASYDVGGFGRAMASTCVVLNPVRRTGALEQNWPVYLTLLEETRFGPGHGIARPVLEQAYMVGYNAGALERLGLRDRLVVAPSCLPDSTPSKPATTEGTAE